MNELEVVAGLIVLKGKRSLMEDDAGAISNGQTIQHQAFYIQYVFSSFV